MTTSSIHTLRIGLVLATAMMLVGSVALWVALGPPASLLTYAAVAMLVITVGTILSNVVRNANPDRPMGRLIHDADETSGRRGRVGSR